MIASSPSSPTAIEPVTLLKIIVQGFALLAWLWHLRRIPRSLRPILFFLLMSVAVENGALIMRAYVEHNTELYNAWIPVMVTLLCYWLWHTMAHRLASLCIGLVLACYFILLMVEATSPVADRILFQRSVLFGYACISALCAVQLIRLTTLARGQLWREPLFWTCVAFFASLGPALPYLGLLNHLYKVDQLKADALFTIIDVLFLIQFSALGIAGVLLPKPQRIIDHARV